MLLGLPRVVQKRAAAGITKCAGHDGVVVAGVWELCWGAWVAFVMEIEAQHSRQHHAVVLAGVNHIWRLYKGQMPNLSTWDAGCGTFINDLL